MSWYAVSAVKVKELRIVSYTDDDLDRVLCSLYTNGYIGRNVLSFTSF